MPPLIQQCCLLASESKYGRFPELDKALEFFEVSIRIFTEHFNERIPCNQVYFIERI